MKQLLERNPRYCNHIWDELKRNVQVGFLSGRGAAYHNMIGGLMSLAIAPGELLGDIPWAMRGNLPKEAAIDRKAEQAEKVMHRPHYVDHKTPELPDEILLRLNNAMGRALAEDIKIAPATCYPGPIAQQRETLRRRIDQVLGEGSSELFEYRQSLSPDGFKVRIDAVQRTIKLQKEQYPALPLKPIP